MSNTIRLRPFGFRHLQMRQRVIAGQWKNRTLPQDLQDGDYADKYPSDEGNWDDCADNWLHEDNPWHYVPGWLEQTKVRRAKLRKLVQRRRLR